MPPNAFSCTKVLVHKPCMGSNGIKKVPKTNHSKSSANKYVKQKNVVIETTSNPSYLDEQINDEVQSKTKSTPETEFPSETHREVTCMLKLEHDTFRMHFHKYIEFIACKTIGDHGIYLKHIQKEKKNHNASATAQIEAINYFECLTNALLSIEQKFEMMANHRILCMISSLRQSPSPPTKLKNYWCVCSLTGMPSNELIEVSTNFKIDAQFGPLTMALWLCIHLEAIEQARVESFTTDHTKQSFISEIIAVYLKSDTAMSMCDVYRWAFQKIFSTFDKTLQTLPEVIKRAKNIPSIEDLTLIDTDRH